MCTVTFLPLDGAAAITANRDETPLRAASGLSPHLNTDRRVYHIAKEPLHGGTNMAIGEDGTVYVLLNGAFEAHPFGKNYAVSRGIMVLECLNYGSLAAFVQSFDFSDTEPFTLLRFGDRIEEIRWDGSELHEASFPLDQPKIWASAQLYSPEAIQNRQEWFADLLKNNPGPEEVFQFHQTGGNGDPGNDMVMNRGGLVQTVSVTGVVADTREVAIHHLDLVSGSQQDVLIAKQV